MAFNWVCKTFCTKSRQLLQKNLRGTCNDENSSKSNDDEDTTTEDNANITNDNEENFSGGFRVVMSKKDDNIKLTDY